MAISVPQKSLILLCCVLLFVATGLMVYFMSIREDAVILEEDGSILLHQEKEAPVEVVEVGSPEGGPLLAAHEMLTNKVVETDDAQQALTPMPEEQSMPSEVGPFAKSAAVLAQQSYKVDPPMREIGRAWLDNEGGQDFFMPVTGERDIEIEIERFEALGRDGGMFVGSVKGHPGSSVQLSYRGKAEAGTIRLPSENRIYRIFPGQDGKVIVQERDLAMAELPIVAQPLINAVVPPVPDFTPPSPPSNVVEDGPES